MTLSRRDFVAGAFAAGLAPKLGISSILGDSPRDETNIQPKMTAVVTRVQLKESPLDDKIRAPRDALLIDLSSIFLTNNAPVPLVVSVRVRYFDDTTMQAEYGWADIINLHPKSVGGSLMAEDAEEVPDTSLPIFLDRLHHGMKEERSSPQTTFAPIQIGGEWERLRVEFRTPNQWGLSVDENGGLVSLPVPTTNFGAVELTRSYRQENTELVPHIIRGELME